MVDALDTIRQLADHVCLEVGKRPQDARSAVEGFAERLRVLLDVRRLDVLLLDEEIHALYPIACSLSPELATDPQVMPAASRVLSGVDHAEIPPEGLLLERSSPGGDAHDWLMIPALVGENRLGLCALGGCRAPYSPILVSLLSRVSARVLLAFQAGLERERITGRLERTTRRQQKIEGLVVELERRQKIIQETYAALEQTRRSLDQVDLERRRIMDSVPSVLFALNGSGELLYQNKTFERLFDGTDPRGVVQGVLGELPRKSLELTTADEQGHSFEIQRDSSEHGVRTFKVSVIPILPGTSTVSAGAARYLLVLSDRSEERALIEARAAALAEGRRAQDLQDALSELAQAHEELKRTQARLLQSQKLEAIGKLSGGIAHDYNNILCAVLGHANFVLDNMPVGSPGRGDIEGIIAASERGANLTRQLLAFSRKQILQPRVVDVNKIIDGMQSMLRRLIGANIELTSTLESPLQVRVDPSQLEQVLLNLVVNARGAMPSEGGRIEIRTRMLPVAPSQVRYGLTTPRQGPVVEISVSDNGSGMTDEVLERVFEPFFTTKDMLEGTGLGMSTVHGIIEQSQGGIELSSTVGEGTVVRVFLPLVARPAAPMRQERSPTDVGASRLKHAKILLVEDDDMIRRLCKRTLERSGFEVVAAEDGERGLHEAAKGIGLFDVLVTDMVMPKRTGRELAHQVQAIDPNIKVLMMSGYTEDAILREGRQLGVEQLLQKPFSPGELVRAVTSLIDR